MASRITTVALRLALAVVLASAPTVATHRLLNASGPLIAVTIWAILFTAAMVLAAELRAAGLPAARRAVRWAMFVLGALGAFVLVADMVIIPLSAYLLWYELVAAGDARGALSFVYVMLVAYGSAVFSATVVRRPLVSIAAYLGWLSFLAVPVFRRPEPVFVLLGAAVILVVAGVARTRLQTGSVRAALHALTLLLLSVVAALGLGRVTSPEGSSFVNNVLSPTLRETVVNLVPSFPIIYDIPGYGYRFSTSTLGRTPVQSSRALFQVEPVENESIYLRTAVYHEYTGGSWRVGPEVSAPGFVGQADAIPPEELAGMRETRITLLADFYSMVPHTLDTRALTISDREEYRLQQSDERSGYTLAEPLLSGDQLTLYRDASRTRAAAGDTANAGAPDGDAGTADPLLAVPVSVADELQPLADALRGETDAQTIVNTLRFLRDGFEYTLEPPQPADRSSFLTAFLTEHQRGFCVHYATAFTVLSRLQGIPARYATGFLVRPLDPEEMAATGGFAAEQAVMVSGYSAHAWSEVYLPDVGWRVVESTPPMQPVGYENTFFERFASIRNEGRTYLQLESILGFEMDASERGSQRWFRLPSVSVWFWTVPVAGIVGLVVFMTFRSRDPQRRFRRAARRLRDRSVGHGYPAPEEAGWTGWSRRGGRHVRRAASLALAVFFGGRTPTSRDVRYLRRVTASALKERPRRR